MLRQVTYSEYFGFQSKALGISKSNAGPVDELVEQDDGRKRGRQEAEFQERILIAQLGQIKARLSSYSSKSDKQKSRTLCWGSLAWVLLGGADN